MTIERLTEIILNAPPFGDSCPLCGYGAWWGNLHRDEKGVYRRSESDIKAAHQLAEYILKETTDA